jgi:hypothetical protein
VTKTFDHHCSITLNIHCIGFSYKIKSIVCLNVCTILCTYLHTILGFGWVPGLKTAQDSSSASVNLTSVESCQQWRALTQVLILQKYCNVKGMKRALKISHALIWMRGHVSACLYVRRSVCWWVCQSVGMSVCQSVGLSICLSVGLSVYLSVCLSVSLSVSGSVCICVCLSSRES